MRFPAARSDSTLIKHHKQDLDALCNWSTKSELMGGGTNMMLETRMHNKANARTVHPMARVKREPVDHRG